MVDRMSASKARIPFIPAGLRRVIAAITGPRRPLALSLLLLAVFFGSWYLVWRDVRGHVLASSQYVVGPQDVEITPLPPWIHSDIRADAYRTASLDGPLSVLDDRLTERIASAFSLHPWVAKVRRVSKRYPARVQIDLDYRRPVLMVQVPGNLLPVDPRGVLLPGGDLSAVEKSRFPCLVGVDRRPLGTAGEAWGDARVAGAAAIADALADAWQELKLAQIVPLPPGSSGVAEDSMYALLTRSGTRIIWGRPPGENTPGEPSAADKVAWLKTYAAQRGTLEGRDGPQQLDLRRP
jgi:hypothetical protein